MREAARAALRPPARKCAAAAGSAGAPASSVAQWLQVQVKFKLLGARPRDRARERRGPLGARLEPSSCVRTLWRQCGASVRGQAVTVGGGGANMMAPALSWALVASMVCGGLGFAPSASSPTLAHFRRSSRLEKRLRGVYGPRPDAVAAVRRARGVPVSRSTPRPPSGIGDV